MYIYVVWILLVNSTDFEFTNFLNVRQFFFVCFSCLQVALYMKGNYFIDKFYSDKFFFSNHTRHIYDVNFTILFNNWTYDLPEGLLNNYRDLSFLYDKFGMEIYYWVEDPPEKEGELCQ